MTEHEIIFLFEDIGEMIPIISSPAECTTATILAAASASATFALPIIAASTAIYVTAFILFKCFA